jgi:hypothetical protein
MKGPWAFDMLIFRFFFALPPHFRMLRFQRCNKKPYKYRHSGDMDALTI